MSRKSSVDDAEAPITNVPAVGRVTRYLGLITALYVAMQLISDVTAGLIVVLGPFAVSATVLYFPVTYIFADILTEVYGYARARRVLYVVLLASVAAGLIYQGILLLPNPRTFDGGPAYERVFGQVPRVLLGGWIAVFTGELLNDYVLAKMKVATKGKHLWLRTIGSTVVGQFANTVLFYTIALYGVLPTDLFVTSVLSGWLLKVGVEIVFTPVTYRVVTLLKRREGMDVFDTNTDFNPFRLRLD